MTNNFKSLKYNMKIMNLPLRILALFYIFFVLTLNNTCFLTLSETALIMQFLLAPLGVILFSDIASLEYEVNVHEIVFTKKASFYYTVIKRLIISFVYLIVLELFVLLFLKYRNGTFDMAKALFSGVTNALVLGTISVIISFISKNKITGMTFAFMYYIFEFLSKGKYTKSFYLLSYIQGNIRPVYNLFIISIIAIIIFIAYLKLKKD